MVDPCLRRTLSTFEASILLLLIAAADIQKIAGHRRRERLTLSMLGSLENSTRDRSIERYMRNHLENYGISDSSFLHVIIHHKANPRTVKAVLKGCSGMKSLMIRMDDKEIVNSVNATATLTKIARVVGIYEEVDDIDPYKWKEFYGMSWNPRAKIAIWLGRSAARNNSLDKIKFEKILASFWSINAINVVLLVTPWCDDESNCSESAEPRVFGYDPFVPVGCGKRGKLFERSPNEPFFPDKLKNLHGTPIRVSMYHQDPHAVLINHTKLKSGLDVQMIRYASDRMNFTIELVTSLENLTSFATRMANGETLGPIGDILNNRSEYLGNAEPLENAWGRRVEFLRPFGFMMKVIIVPQAHRMPVYVRLLRSSNAYVIGLMLIASLGLLCYLIVMKKRYPLLIVFRLLMHQQIRGIGNETSERVFLICWIFWAYITCTAIQTELTDDLTDPPFHENIDTLEQLSKSGLIVKASEVDIESLRNSSLDMQSRLAENFVAELSVSSCIEDLLSGKNVACVARGFHALEIFRNLDRQDRMKPSMNRQQDDRTSRANSVHIVRENLVEYTGAIIVDEGFPYSDEFDVAYFAAVENGFLVKWWRQDMARDWKPHRPKAKLNSDHLDGIFTILLIGNGVASIVFLAEILLYRVKGSKPSSGTILSGSTVFSDRPARLDHERRRRILESRRIPMTAVERL